MPRTPVLLFGLWLAAPALAASDDPRQLIPATPPPLSARAGTSLADCTAPVPARALTLPDLIDIALCRNPATAASWAAARGAAANIGVASASTLPSVSATVGPQFNRFDYFDRPLPGAAQSDTNVSAGASLGLSYLLFDFGGRVARIDSARASSTAALASYADTAQAVAINTVTAYNAVLAGEASETASQVSVEYLQQALGNARARRSAGVATSADALQAQTAYEQANYNLVQARGATQVARGQLASAIGLPPQTALQLAPPPPLASVDLLSRDVGGLIEAAERLRPDLRAARAQTQAAEANLRAARADGRPSVSTSASIGGSYADTLRDGVSSTAGITMSIPLFTGYSRTYQIAGAQAALDQARAQAEVSRQSAALGVWTSYTNLDTQLKSLASARALIASAQASADIAQGRYKAGVGTVTDTLNAAAALATARQQLVAAEFGVRNAQAQLARSVGQIGEAVDGQFGDAVAGQIGEAAAGTRN